MMGDMPTATKTPLFSVQEYMKMDRAGVFERRVELINGRIHRTPAQAHSHMWAISKSSYAFRSRLSPAQFWVIVQGTLILDRNSAPDPDLYILDSQEGLVPPLYARPILVLEISDKTYSRDSGVKLRKYASAGIGDYWIMNFKARQIEVYRDPVNVSGGPKGWRYNDTKHYHHGESIRMLLAPNLDMAVDELMP